MIKTQQGATLAVSLILLLIITLIGISAMQVTQLQEKMSSNFQDKLLSFTAAESALRAGEQFILNQTSVPSTYATCPSLPCVHDRYLNLDYSAQADSWWAANGAAYGVNLTDVATQPRYVVEYLQFVPDSPILGSSSTKSTGVYYYQISAKGTGATDSAGSILQTTVARRF